VDTATSSERDRLPTDPGLEIVFRDVRTGEERALGVVDGHVQAQAFISGAIAAIEASGAYARGYEAGLALRPRLA